MKGLWAPAQYRPPHHEKRSRCSRYIRTTRHQRDHRSRRRERQRRAVCHCTEPGLLPACKPLRSPGVVVAFSRFTDAWLAEGRGRAFSSNNRQTHGSIPCPTGVNRCCHRMDLRGQPDRRPRLCRAKTSSVGRTVLICRSESAGGGLAGYPTPILGNTVGIGTRFEGDPGRSQPVIRYLASQSLVRLSIRRPSGDGTLPAATTNKRKDRSGTNCNLLIRNADAV